MEFAGRVALITGGKRIGAVVAAELALRGVDVGLVYRASRAEAEEAAESVRGHGRRALVLQADLQQPDACARIVDETVDMLGRLDVLVNMASIYRQTAIDEVSLDDWNNQMAVDLRSSWLCARAAVPHMRRLRGGRIINFSDWVARSGRPRYPGFLTYYVAKAAVVALTEALALELASDQILVNAIAPGPIVAPEGLTEEEFAAVERTTPLGRWGGELEIAKVVVSLVDNDFITGETIRVDGGRHVK
jgi:NAD(P)-dependent dehydrogenase (short-subunit alcohol dehydrogenase family)